MLALSLVAMSLAGPPPPAPPSVTQFASTFSDYAVLQQAGANKTQSAVYGTAQAGAQLAITVSESSETFDAYTVKSTVDISGQWKVLLRPADGGGDVMVTAHCTAGCTNTTDAVLDHVTFGDVWYCAGQSNMWLPMAFSYSRNYSVANITNGKYDNVRLMAGDSQHGNAFPWKTAKAATICTNSTTGAPVACPYAGPTLFQFSAACWYYAEALTDRFVAAGKTPPALGMINTAIGGSMIEEWTPNATLAGCTNHTTMAADQMLWTKNVVPYLDMTVKGFLWYQGENNMHGVKGNSLHHSGYACMMPAMIASWRASWSKVSHTTDPAAPFGMVTIPDSGTEGGADVGAFRLAQTGSYGVLPNTAMPNTFLAQAFDLDDPWGDKTCYGYGCCDPYQGPGQEQCIHMGCDKPNRTVAAGAVCIKMRCPAAFNGTGCGASLARDQLPRTGCDAYCAALHGTPVYMGGIHPRLKRPVGERLATAAFNQVYGGSAASTGPTISSCAVGGSTLTVTFDPALLRSSGVVVQQNRSAHPTTLQVLTNASLYCLEPMLVSVNSTCPPNPHGAGPNPACKGRAWVMVTGWQCPADPSAEVLAAHYALLDRLAHGSPGLGGEAPFNPYNGAWSTVVPTLGAAPGTVDIDVSRFTGGAGVFGVRYAMDGNCCDACGYRSRSAPDGSPCDSSIGISSPCPAQACPLINTDGLPANPFQAKIIAGKCSCAAPQVC